MIDARAERRPSASETAERAMFFISKGWREVRDSADADLRLMRARARTFKSIADRELENFLISASPFAVPAVRDPAAAPQPGILAELEFLKQLNPALSKIGRAYSPLPLDFGRESSFVAQLRSDLPASSVAAAARRVNWKVRRWDEEEEGGKDWEPIRILKSEWKSQSNKLVGKSSEFMEKVKLSLKAIIGEYQEAKDVPPLYVPELLACLVKQSRPLFDQLGLRSDICDTLLDSLSGRRKGQLMSNPLSIQSLFGNSDLYDELDLRIARVLRSALGGSCMDFVRQDTTNEKSGIAIVTTASLPWMTGTAVNPLFRAAYLANTLNQNVTLVVPWLFQSDQEIVYPNNMTFSSPEEQEAYMREWLEERVGFKSDFDILFYPGKFSKDRRSILPVGDTTQFIPRNVADIAILEEPEHLNWYHHGVRWTDRFNHVIGVVHTNYLEYIKREKYGALQSFLVKHINNWVTRVYCHKVLRLSAATQDLPRSVVCNVHGVNPKFLKIGEKNASEMGLGWQQPFSKGAYFLGKMVWAKGYRELIDLMATLKTDLKDFEIDVYGNGEDSNEVQSVAKRLNLSLNFMEGRDHSDDSFHSYKVFVNPSVSDVLCTATAEALAMGKFVVCADHPSNDFFKAFPNCLTYNSPEHFIARVREAMEGEPQPLSPEQMHKLSWEAATQRLMKSSGLGEVLGSDEDCGDRPSTMHCDDTAPPWKPSSLPILTNVFDGGLAFAHYCLTGSELLRLSTGAIPGTRDYSVQHCMDLHLLPPQNRNGNPIYGW